MIKVNLMKGGTRSGRTQVTDQTNLDAEFDLGGLESGSSGSQQDLVLKVVIFLAGAGLLMLYEMYNIGELRDQQAKFKTKSQALQAEIKKNESVSKRAIELQAQIKELEDRINAIKEISKTRLREIKSIDYIQNVIPEKVWLSSVQLKDDQMYLKGNTLSDEQLNRLIEQLEGRSYFRNVVLERAMEMKTKEGTYKTFEISSMLTSVE